MLLEEDMISEELVDKMRSWKHSGFSVHRGSSIKSEDEDSRKTLSEYISRPPPEPLELVCEPDADYIPWQDDVPEIEVG